MAPRFQNIRAGDELSLGCFARCFIFRTSATATRQQRAEVVNGAPIETSGRDRNASRGAGDGVVGETPAPSRTAGADDQRRHNGTRSASRVAGALGRGTDGTLMR
ncbi:hypothetical protein MRX96_020626 [Rhipicephalus microplus]